MKEVGVCPGWSGTLYLSWSSGADVVLHCSPPVASGRGAKTFANLQLVLEAGMCMYHVLGYRRAPQVAAVWGEPFFKISGFSFHPASLPFSRASAVHLVNATFCVKKTPYVILFCMEILQSSSTLVCEGVVTYLCLTYGETTVFPSPLNLYDFQQEMWLFSDIIRSREGVGNLHFVPCKCDWQFVYLLVFCYYGKQSPCSLFICND